VTDLHSTLFWLRLAQVIVAIPLFALAGQAATYVFARIMGQVPRQNFIYRLFQIVASPVVNQCRWITPRFIPDRHLPLVGFSLLLGAYLWIMIEIAAACGRHGLAITQCLQSQ